MARWRAQLECHSALAGYPGPQIPGVDWELSTHDVSHVAWYGVLACYELGIILEGTHARAFAGQAPKDTGDLLHATTVALFERALGWIE